MRLCMSERDCSDVDHGRSFTCTSWPSADAATASWCCLVQVIQAMMTPGHTAESQQHRPSVKPQGSVKVRTPRGRPGSGARGNSHPALQPLHPALQAAAAANVSSAHRLTCCTINNTRLRPSRVSLISESLRVHKIKSNRQMPLCTLWDRGYISSQPACTRNPVYYPNACHC